MGKFGRAGAWKGALKVHNRLLKKASRYYRARRRNSTNTPQKRKKRKKETKEGRATAVSHLYRIRICYRSSAVCALCGCIRNHHHLVRAPKINGSGKLAGRSLVLIRHFLPQFLLSMILTVVSEITPVIISLFSSFLASSSVPSSLLHNHNSPAKVPMSDGANLPLALSPYDWQERSPIHCMPYPSPL